MILLSLCLVTQVIVHEPNLPYGLCSDTGGSPSGYWQRLADDISVGETTPVGHVTWWGSYRGDVVPDSETFRVSLYVSDGGLPGVASFVGIVSNPPRVATGGVILNTEPGLYSEAAEYRFEADLGFTLWAETPYWLEIVQLGDPSSRFYWTHSAGYGDVLARCRSGLPHWATGSLRDMAFCLSPEPIGVLLWLPFILRRPSDEAGRPLHHASVPQASRR